MTVQNDFGLIGLAVMGRDLVLNVESRGFGVSVCNRAAEVTRGFVAAHPGKRQFGAATLAEFVASLSRPRKVMLMAKAGAAVEAVIVRLLPLLDEGDIVIDGGNSPYTERRDAGLREPALPFIGASVSGGKEGPVIVPVGPSSTGPVMRPNFGRIAAMLAGPTSAGLSNAVSP